MTTQFLHETASVRRGLVADLTGKHLKGMRQAVWLYLYLLLAANRRTGSRLLAPALVAREMGIPEATVRSWLGHIRKGGYVTLAREGDLLRVTVNKWRQSEPARTRNAQSSEPGPRRTSAPITAGALAEALGADLKDPFLVEVAEKEDPERVQSILDEVTRVPASKIKKSRLALFRYLLKKNP